jgi:hypothetical protein
MTVSFLRVMCPSARAKNITRRGKSKAFFVEDRRGVFRYHARHEEAHASHGEVYASHE